MTKYPTAILVRMTLRQKALFAAVAADSHVSVVEWIRATLDKAARGAP